MMKPTPQYLEWLADLVDKSSLSAMVDSFVDDLSKRYAKFGLVLWMDLFGTNTLSISKIELTKRGAGAGSKVMQEIVGFADRNGLGIELEASEGFGTSFSKLVNWYKSFGFIPVGKPQDMGGALEQTMRRKPKSKTRVKADSEVPLSPDGKIDTQALKTIIFSQPLKLPTLNQILAIMKQVGFSGYPTNEEEFIARPPYGSRVLPSQGRSIIEFRLNKATPLSVNFKSLLNKSGVLWSQQSNLFRVSVQPLKTQSNDVKP